jgi:hypothetical protein
MARTRFNPRDPQQYKAYDAEDEVRRLLTVGIDERGQEVTGMAPRAEWVLAPLNDWRFIGVTHRPERQRLIPRVRQLVDATTASDWWRAAGGPSQVVTKVTDRYACSSRGGRYGGYYGVTILGTADHCSVLVIAHELAHVLDRAVKGTMPGGGHGRRWAGAFLGLTQVMLGHEAMSDLALSFIKHGVTFETGEWPDVPDAEPLAHRQARLRHWWWMAGSARPIGQPMAAKPAAPWVEPTTARQGHLF